MPATEEVITYNRLKSSTVDMPLAEKRRKLRKIFGSKSGYLKIKGGKVRPV